MTCGREIYFKEILLKCNTYNIKILYTNQVQSQEVDFITFINNLIILRVGIPGLQILRIIIILLLVLWALLSDKCFVSFCFDRNVTCSIIIVRGAASVTIIFLELDYCMTYLYIEKIYLKTICKPFALY